VPLYGLQCKGTPSSPASDPMNTVGPSPRPQRTGPMLPRRPLPWPAGVRAAMCVTFDVDAETMWTSRDAQNWERPGVLSQADYEIGVGLGLIMDMLERKELRSTFFVPGWVAEQHRDVIAEVHQRGHEVAHHGYLHDPMDGWSIDRERDAIRAGVTAIEQATASRPIGYRAPLYGVNAHTWTLLREEGFSYSSNMMDALHPYLHDGGPELLVEVPVHWLLDDGPYYLLSFHPPNHRQMIKPETVIEGWREELAGVYELGGVLTLTLHPQLTGRPSRLRALDRFIDHARSYESLWLPTMRELSDACRAATGS
jgi:peptidoglycan/xylan/chitin deacetylase (PgdA/CDA1 family)